MKNGQKSPLFHQEPYLWGAPCHSQDLRLFPEHIRPVHSLSTQGTDKWVYMLFLRLWKMPHQALASVRMGCASDVLCGYSVCLLQVLSQVPWRASGMSCVTDTFLCKTWFIFYTLSHLCLCCWPLRCFPQAGASSMCCLPVLSPMPGSVLVLPLGVLAGWQSPGTAFGRECETLLVLIWSEAAAGRKANWANMETNKQLYFEITGLRADELQSCFNTKMWGHFWREATPLALELQSCLEILRKFLFVIASSLNHP